jgi:hypothetical protein
MRLVMLAAKAMLVFAFCALTSNEAIAAPPVHDSVATDLHQLRHHFDRSEQEHSRSMAVIMQNMTSHSALEVLRQNSQAGPELVALAQTAVSHTRLRASRQSPPKPPKGLPAVESAKYMLNHLLEESMMKYDLEILKCRDFYTNQCGLLETARGTIAGAGEKAAQCRTHVLAAQAQIDVKETNIPAAKQSLSEHKKRCKSEVQVIHGKMQVIGGDIEQMSKILAMSACGSSLLQTGRRIGQGVKLLRCTRECDATSLVSVDHAPLRRHIDLLKSRVAHQLLQQSFSDLDEHDGSPSNAVRRSVIPASPCNDPTKGAPSPKDKRMAKCTVSGKASCTKLQERFMLIQSSLRDEKDTLKENVVDLEKKCEETETTMSRLVQDEEQSLKEHQTKLAEATSCEAEAGEESRLTNIEFDELNEELSEMQKTCTTNYQALESEMCGIKKIRTELYTKMQGGGGGSTPFFTDCKLSEWTPGECSKECGGGMQKMSRTIDSPPQGGAKCLPLEEVRQCNAHPCPIDCKLSSWDGWSSCSAECGGGVQQRLRSVERQMKHNGNPCGETSETKPCNIQSCEKPCELSEWTKWTPCSKACDGGTRQRIKWVKTPAADGGTCPAPDSSERVKYRKCNTKSCPKPKSSPTIQCDAKLDVVLILDGSGSLGESGWKATKKAAEMIVGSLDKKQNQVAVLVYSGPKKWKDVKRCFGNEPVSQEFVCKQNWLVHFSANSIGEAKTKLKYTAWPKGGTLTSLALNNAVAEISNGRQDAKTVVIVITDGRPNSKMRTRRAARAVRKVARLMWVPVTKFAPLKMIRRMASRRWQENVVLANSFTTLEKPDFIDHIIADMCPKLKKGASG